VISRWSFRLTFEIRHVFIVVIALLVTSNAFSASRVLTAVTLEYPPYEFSVNGEAQGIAVEIIEEAIRRTNGNSINFTFLPWKRAVYSVKSGQGDILFNAGKNEERQQWGRYGENVLILQKYVLFKKRNADIQVNPYFDNVKDYSIAVRLGYLYGSGNFKKALKENKFSRVSDSKSTKQSVDMLLGDRIDLFVGDYLPVMHYLKSNGLEENIDIVKRSDISTDDLVVLVWPTYMLFNKDSVSESYIEKVNQAMTQMKLDGFIDAVFERYK